MSVYFEPLLPLVIPKLRVWLGERVVGVKVSDRVIAGERLVRVMEGSGGARVELLDTPTLRVAVRVSDGLPDAQQALDLLVALVRAYFDGPVADGAPVTWSRVTSGPVPVESPTGTLEKYLVVDLRRRGSEL